MNAAFSHLPRREESGDATVGWQFLDNSRVDWRTVTDKMVSVRLLILADASGGDRI